MTKLNKNRIRWIGLSLFIGLCLWFAYDLHFKFEINTYQAKQIEKQLQENFDSKKDDFNSLLTLSKKIGLLENVEFGKNEVIRFQIYDTLLDRTNDNNTFINIGENSIYDIKEIEFSVINSIHLSLEDTLITIKNWIIHFQGKKTNPLVKKLLAYNGITVQQLTEIEEKLVKIDCSGFDKNNELLRIRYKGHWGESFNYIIPLVETTNTQSWNHLENDYYWEHYVNGLFCGWTDW